MMNSPGLGVSEVGQALRRCGDIRDLFFNEYRNAGRQLKAFQSELESISKFLTTQFELRRRTGRELPGLVRLQETLEECWTYLSKHRNTLRRYPELDAREKLDKAFRTMVFDIDRDLDKFRNRLMQHRVDSMVFMVQHLVERDLDRVDAGPSASPRQYEAETTLNALSPLDKKLANLTSALYTYRRLKIGNSVSLAPGQDRERQNELKQEIEKSVLELCDEVDLPPIQLSALSLRLDRDEPVKERWQGVLESTPLPTNARGNATVRYTEGMEEVYQRARDVNAGAVIEIDGHNPIHASGYRIFGRCCYWTNEAEKIVLEHHLPESSRKGCPYSKHRMYNKPYSLSFLVDQDLVIRDPDRGYKEQRSGLRPQYHFGDELMMRQFQADLRRKEFLGEYHIASISAKNGIQKTKECVNLWQSRDGARDITISFSLRLSSAMETYELPMRWFYRPESQGSTTTIKLDLVRDTGARPSNSRRTSRLPSFSTLRNKPFRSSTETLASVNTIGTIQSMSGAETAPDEWIRRLEFLKLDFEKPGEAQSFLSQAFDSASGMSTRTPSLITAPTPRTVSPDLMGSPIQRRDTGTSPLSPRPTRVVNIPSGELRRSGVPYVSGPGSIHLPDPYSTPAGGEDFVRVGTDHKGETPTGLLHRYGQEHQHQYG